MTGKVIQRWQRMIRFGDGVLRDHPWLLLGGLLLAIGAGPWLLPPTALNIAILIGMYMIAASGLNITVGFTGLLDLGYVGFLAIGAYTTAILATTYGMNYWVALALGTGHAAVWGVLRGAPTLRLTGDYFAIVTFGCAELAWLVIRNLDSLTRGARGFPDVAPPTMFGHEFPIDPPIAYWYLVMGLVLATVFMIRRLVYSRVGRAWMAIREDETAAACLGVNVRQYKTYTFAISAGLGGLAGGFYAGYLQNLHPDSFKFLESVWILCMVVIGGMGSITGALLGAIIFVTVRELLRDVLGRVGLPAEALYLLFGTALVLIMRFRPEGLVSTRTMRAELHSTADDAAPHA